MGSLGQRTVVLGAGMTGLAAGFSSGLPIYECTEVPGGICSSYYVRPGETKRLHSPPPDGEAYRFEVGGGHWLWGGDPLILRLIQRLAPLKPYARRAAAYLVDREMLVPCPIQYNLKHLGEEVAFRALSEMLLSNTGSRRIVTMADWLESNFGRTLNQIFFAPHNTRYTAGLSTTISPQDSSKSPRDLQLVIAGAFGITNHDSAGYNMSFHYPVDGLDALARSLARRNSINYSKQAVRIDVKDKTILFADGSVVLFDNLICTLPLDRSLQLAGITLEEQADPFTSVLVTNIGGKRGSRCPREHWVYISGCDCSFHRVGFYSNVDASFLPVSARTDGNRVSIYVETAYLGGQKPKPSEVTEVSARIVAELRIWGWIEETDVVDSTWVETAYTWIRPMSLWAEQGLHVLSEFGVHQVGRYGRWASRVTEQSMTNSIRDGLRAGVSFRQTR
jgi:protoporphyrinogen oxidase